MSTLFLFFLSCFAQQDLRGVLEASDVSDPSTFSLAAVGVMGDVYIHYDVDPTLYSGGSRKFHNQQELIDYVFSLTDVFNRDTFNPVDINLVISSFSFAEEDTDWDVMLNMQEGEVLREGEQHMYVHITDKVAASIAPRFGLYYNNAYAVGATFGGPTFSNGDRSTLSHEIGHLFGLDHSHALSLSYSSEVSVDPDNCGGGPNGKCTNVPELGGTLMSYCYECGWFRAKPLSSLHPFQAEKIQQYYRGSLGSALPKISFQKLRSYIPSAASSNECAREGSVCRCNGVVYFGPRYSSSMTAKIYAVTSASGSVSCSSGAGQSFPDVLHGAAKRCYCHQGAALMDVSYLPEPVEWASEGVGACQMGSQGRRTWDNSGSEQNVGYFTITGQPEWKCAQECLDRNACKGYNWNTNLECRLYEGNPIGASNSGIFRGSTCWRRPGATRKYPRASHVERPMPDSGNPSPTGEWSSWGQWGLCSATCGGGVRVRTRTCRGSGSCSGSDSQSQQCSTLPCPIPDSDSNGAQYEDLGIGRCQTVNGQQGIVLCKDPLEVCNQRCTDLCDADCDCTGYMLAANSQNCMLFYDTLRSQVGHRWQGASTCMRKTQCATEEGEPQQPDPVTQEPTYQVPNPVTREPTYQITAEPTEAEDTSSGDYTSLGNGYCLNESGSGTRGMGHIQKTDAQCRQTCEEFGTLCTGYASKNSGSGTCYVYGRIEYTDRPEGWRGAGTWNSIDPVRGSGNVPTMTCYRKN